MMADGPRTAVLAAICGVFIQTVFPHRKVVIHQLLFNVGMIGLTATLSGFAYEMARFGRNEVLSNQLIAVLTAALVYFFGNSGFVSMIIGLSRKTSIARVWIDHFAYTAPSFLIAGVVSLLTLQLLATPSLILMMVLLICPVYYSSIQLASRQLVLSRLYRRG
jgi:hypothetical protein